MPVTEEGTGDQAGDVRVSLDRRTRLWRDGRIAFGGAPWGVVRVSPAVAQVIRLLDTAGRTGAVTTDATQRAAARQLVRRGLAHPVPVPATDPGAGLTVDVVVPAYERPDLLDACLSSLRPYLNSSRPGGRPPVGEVVVVDDASTSDAVAEVARRHGARVVRHPVNRGPAAARNTGVAATSSPVVAFLDADCRAHPGWLERLLPLFDDARVGAVAPRVVPRTAQDTLLARHERTRSALDMGPHRALVRYGAALGFLPSAALLVRREALTGAGFDERLRLGEDVDLVWRLTEAGWQVRYEPGVVVHHEMRATYRDWAVRRYEYGTSAADLDRRHPGRLAPARWSGWNVAAVAAALAGRPLLATGIAGAATAALGARLRSADVDPAVAPVVVGMGVVADATAAGHALRREWWPLGWLALTLALAGRSRTARAAAAAMLVPVALEWGRQRPQVDLIRYLGLRLVEDAAYGCGVIVSAVRRRRPSVLIPEVRLPHLGTAARSSGDP